ncbi:MAG: rhomboid family intramembrane serine protease [Myxococcota bacterium]
MIPLRDNNPVSQVPVVVYLLLGINALVWLFQVFLWLSEGLGGMHAFVAEWGLTPAAFIDGKPGAFLTPVTSMFMHGGWWHVIGNLWFLWIFGDNVEDALGKGRFVAFYLLSGLAAAATQIAIDPFSSVPMVGASGAIAGVLAAYVVLYPKARVITVIPFLALAEVPAFLFIFVWFGLQLLSAYASLGTIGANVGGTAFFAHVGGFVAGLGLLFALRPSKAPPKPEPARERRWANDRFPPPPV